MNERTAQHYQQQEAKMQAELDNLRAMLYGTQTAFDRAKLDLEQAEDDCNAMAAQVVYWRNRVTELRKELRG